MSDIIDELSLMVALFPDDTGLPMPVWASPSYGVAHDIGIKVMQAHGHLPKDDLDAVTAWWRLNQAPLLDYWRQSPPLPTGQFMARLQKLGPPIPP